MLHPSQNPVRIEPVHQNLLTLVVGDPFKSHLKLFLPSRGSFGEIRLIFCSLRGHLFQSVTYGKTERKRSGIASGAGCSTNCFWIRWDWKWWLALGAVDSGKDLCIRRSSCNGNMVRSWRYEDFFNTYGRSLQCPGKRSLFGIYTQGSGVIQQPRRREG